METEFYVGQKVVDILYGGEGMVLRVVPRGHYNTYPVIVSFFEGIRTYTLDGKFVSDNKIRWLYPVGTSVSIRTPAHEESSTLFQLGDIVYDLRFGQGKVVSTGSVENGYQVRVSFDSGKTFSYCHDGKASKNHLEPILKLLKRKEKCKFHVGDAVISLLSGPGTVIEIGEHSVSVSFESYTETYDKDGIYLPYQYPTLFLTSENPTLKQIIGSTDDNIRNG